MSGRQPDPSGFPEVYSGWIFCSRYTRCSRRLCTAAVRLIPEANGGPSPKMPVMEVGCVGLLLATLSQLFCMYIYDSGLYTSSLYTSVATCSGWASEADSGYWDCFSSRHLRIELQGAAPPSLTARPQKRRKRGWGADSVVARQLGSPFRVCYLTPPAANNTSPL